MAKECAYFTPYNLNYNYCDCTSVMYCIAIGVLNYILYVCTRQCACVPVLLYSNYSYPFMCSNFTPDTFRQFPNDIEHDQTNVDGVSITLGRRPRKHIWMYSVWRGQKFVGNHFYYETYARTHTHTHTHK